MSNAYLPIQRMNFDLTDWAEQKKIINTGLTRYQKHIKNMMYHKLIKNNVNMCITM